MIIIYLKAFSLLFQFCKSMKVLWMSKIKKALSETFNYKNFTIETIINIYTLSIPRWRWKQIHFGNGEYLSFKTDKI